MMKSLADWAKTRDPDGKTAKIVEILRQRNGILDDMIFREGNLTTGHRVSIRTGLPKAYWKILNRGVPISTSQTAQVDEQSGIMQAWGECDVDLANLEDDERAYRLSEATAFIQGMNNTMASTLFYGNSSENPEQFNGLSVRYSSKSAGSGENIIDAGGTGSDNASIWFVKWGEQSTFGIFPKGSKAGLIHEDKGKAVLESPGNKSEGRRLEVYRDKFQWNLGLVLKNWTDTVRIANIDVSDLASADPKMLTKLLIRAVHHLDDFEAGGKTCCYMNRTLLQYLDVQRWENVSNSGITFEKIDGKLMPHFRYIPIRRVDALLNTEARVV